MQALGIPKKPRTEEQKKKKREYGLRMRAHRYQKRRDNRDKFPDRLIFNRVKHKCKKEGKFMNITLEDVKIPSHCPVLGIPLFRTPGIRSNNTPSIDRIDNSKGYIKGNVIIVSDRANRIKNDATVKELGKIYRFYKALKKKK